MSCYFDALRKYADFRGRASRKEFWMFLLVHLTVSWVLFGLLYFIGIVELGILLYIYLFATLCPYVAVSVRRLHDSNHSGWWFLAFVVPFVGLVFLVLDSSRGENRYGPHSNNTEINPVPSTEKKTAKKVAPVESIGKNKNFEIQKIAMEELDTLLSQSEAEQDMIGSEVEKKLAKMESLKEEGVISHKDFEAAKDRLSEQARKDKIEKMNKVYKEEFENKMETLNKLHDDSTLSDDEFERAKNKATEIHEKSLSDIDVSLPDIDSLLSIINYNGHKIHKMEGKFARIYFRIVGVRSVPIFSSIETAKSYIDHFLT